MLDTSTQLVLPKIIDQEHTFEEIRLEVDIENVATETLDRVVKWKNMDSFAVFDVMTCVDIDEITKFHSQVVTRYFVHLNPTLLHFI